jgi:hypothetical protein
LPARHYKMPAQQQAVDVGRNLPYSDTKLNWQANIGRRQN